MASAQSTMLKQYGGEIAWTVSADEGVDRVWRSVFAGQAAVRFHRPPAGIGLNERAQAQLRSLTDELDAFHAQPHQQVAHLLSERQPNAAYLMADPGRACALYFPNGGHVRLDVSQFTDGAVVYWLDTERTEWLDPRHVSDNPVELRTPAEGKWAALVLHRDR